MKKYLFILFLTTPLFAEEEVIIKDLSAGMYSAFSSNKIPDNSVSYIQNFYTDIEPLAVEINGYIKKDATILGGTKAVTGSWSFTDTSGSEWYIAYASRTFYKNTLGGTPTAFGPILTSNQIPDCTANVGKFVCTDGISPVWYFDGTSTATISNAPKGRQIESWRTRVVISNVPNTQSTLYFSGDGDVTAWTLGGLPTDPFSWPVGGANDGQYIRCLYGIYQDSLIIGRKYDLWAADGFDQDDFTLRQINSQVGCIEDKTIKEVDGELVFLSNRGVEAMNARSIRLISEPIRNITDVVVKNTVNQRINDQTTAPDWGAGTADNNVYVDTQTSPGDVQLTFPDTFDTMRLGNGGSKVVWSTFTTVDLLSSSGSVVSESGRARFTNNSDTLGAIVLQAVNPTNNFAGGTTFHFTISSFTPTSSGSMINRFHFILSSCTSSDPRQSTCNDLELIVIATKTVAGISMSVGPISVSTHPLIPCNLDLWISTSVYSLIVNGSSVAINNRTHSITNHPLYPSFSLFNFDTIPGSVYIDDFGIVPQTVTYTSQLLNIGSVINSWGAVAISDVKNNGNIVYQFGSTTTASVSSISNYTGIVSGGVPTVSTNPYAAFKGSFSNTVATSVVKLSEFVTTWNEGTAAPSPVSTVYDRRYWLSFTTQTGTSPYLDTVLVWQRNKTWTLFKGINAASYAYWRDNLYFGNSNNTGYVYRYDIGNNFDGENISSLIYSKSYDLTNTHRNKSFKSGYLQYTGNSGFTGSFDVSYALEREGNFYSLGTLNMGDDTGQISAKLPFSLSNPVYGREIQIKVVKEGVGDRLRLHDFVLKYDVKEEQ